MSVQIQQLRDQLNANPDNWEIRYSLIYALHEEGQTDEAVEVLSEIEELPSDDVAIVYAAQCYQVLGANEQAHSVFQSALQLNPGNEAAKAGLRSLQFADVEPVAALSDESLVETTSNLAQPPSAGNSLAEEITAAPKITGDDTIPFDPDAAGLVDQIHEAEEESKRRYEASVAKDRINSVIVTVVVHVGIIMALGLVIQQVPRRVPPQIVASSSAETNDPAIEQQKMQKNTLKATNPSEASAADILSVPSVSAISMASLDSFTGSDIPIETGMSFQPSISMGMPSSSNSMMMFGQPLEGETLGVVLDVSGSMAEWLPMVIREVDRNFDDAPIVYIRSPEVIKYKTEDIEVRPVVKEEVVPHRLKDGSYTPFRFLWTDLPKKAPQRSVDRLIETMKTRPNQFIVVGRGDKLGGAMKFLAKENCDAVYVFSDFENYMDEEAALAHGQSLARQKVRAYIQPAVEESDFLKVAAQKIANRTKGRQLPTLASVINPETDEPTSLIVARPTSGPPKVEGVTYARPRDELYGEKRYHYRPDKRWKEIGRHDTPEFTAVFYGPEARALIYLKDKNGKYIQRPFSFHYHSRKYHPEIEDPRARWRWRKFLRNAEPPVFDGKQIVWKMILEDEISFDIFIYLDRKGMNATYVAQPPTDGHGDGAYIAFGVPPLAIEYKDRYFGQDCPESLNLEDVRKFAHPNEVTFNLPRQERDRNKAAWARNGFKPGYNTLPFDELITQFPGGVRSVEVSGPSYGSRVFQARTTSSKIYLGTHSRGDTEPWEGFRATLTRRSDERTRFTKTEAIAFSIEEQVSSGLQ